MMVNVGGLPQAQRLALAGLQGVATRYGIGADRNTPRDVAVAALHEISGDPLLLGVAAGVMLVDPLGARGPVVELLQAAGADMAVAEEHAETIRRRRRAAGEAV